MDTKKRIKYFNFYGCSDLRRYRTCSPAAATKIDYIIESLNEVGYGVDVISNAAIVGNGGFCPAYTITKGINTYHYFAGFGRGECILHKMIAVLYGLTIGKISLFWWCLFHLRRKEQILVYHSLNYAGLFVKLSKIKKLRIIGEIEEIYQDVSDKAKAKASFEYPFIDSCEKFVLPTEILGEKINISHRPQVIINGVYSLKNITEQRFNDGLIHVVYGGTLEIDKGGAYAAVDAAQYLPSNYHVHICGFGDSTAIISKIEDVKTKTYAKVTFEGSLDSNDYERFIQKCDIGLSTQNPTGTYNDTSFPSKILVYLSNALSVVSIRIPVVEQSKLNSLIHYYDTQNGKSIAEAIMKCNYNDIERIRLTLQKLDANFKDSLKQLLSH